MGVQKYALNRGRVLGHRVLPADSHSPGWQLSQGKRTGHRLDNLPPWHYKCCFCQVLSQHEYDQNPSLVVEDDQLFLWSLSQFLKKEGYEVCPVTSGEVAFDLAQHQPFDVVISDFRLPGLNGRDLIRKIKVLQPETKAILISAYQREETGDEEETPWHAYVNKPIELGTVKKLLHDLTDGTELDQ